MPLRELAEAPDPKVAGQLVRIAAAPKLRGVIVTAAFLIAEGRPLDVCERSETGLYSLPLTEYDLLPRLALAALTAGPSNTQLKKLFRSVCR